MHLTGTDAVSFPPGGPSTAAHRSGVFPAATTQFRPDLSLDLPAAAVVARRVHTTVVEVIAAVCGRVRDDTGLLDVVLSGGVFLNALLTGEAAG